MAVASPKTVMLVEPSSIAILCSLEWFWKMRSGALNLNTHHNVVPMASLVRRMFHSSRWALLPDDAIVQQYLECLLQGLTVPIAYRENFPVIEDRDDFRYRLIPVMGMEEVAFMRQNEDPEILSANKFTVHVYPFNTLPVLEQDAIQALIQQFSTLETILKLSSAWRNFIPQLAKEDRSYWPPYDPSPTDDSDDEGNGGDDKNDRDYQDKMTEGGRLGLKRRRAASPTGNHPQTRSAAQRPTQMAIDGDNDIEDTRTEKGRYNPHRKRRGRRHHSAVMAMVEHNRQACIEGWSKEALINWSQQWDAEPAHDVEILVV